MQGELIADMLSDFHIKLTVLAMKLNAMEDRCPDDLAVNAMTVSVMVANLRREMVGLIETGALTLPADATVDNQTRW